MATVIECIGMTDGEMTDGEVTVGEATDETTAVAEAVSTVVGLLTHLPRWEETRDATGRHRCVPEAVADEVEVLSHHGKATSFVSIMAFEGDETTKDGGL